MKAFDFDPNVGFFKLKLIRIILWVALGWFAVSAFGYTGIAIERHDKCGSVECVNYYFLTVLRVPLGGLAVIAAILALMATHHRSEQSRLTIAQSIKAVEVSEKSVEHSESALREAQKHNNFNNYFSALRNFESHMGDYYGFIPDCRRLFNFVYSDAIEGNYSVSQDFFMASFALTDECFKSIRRLKHLSLEDVAVEMAAVWQIYRAFESRVYNYIREPSPIFARSRRLLSLDTNQVLSAGATTNDWFAPAKAFSEVILSIIQFLPLSPFSSEGGLKHELEKLCATIDLLPSIRVARDQHDFRMIDFGSVIERAELELEFGAYVSPNPK